jgi:hypothetical protein
MKSLKKRKTDIDRPRKRWNAKAGTGISCYEVKMMSIRSLSDKTQYGCI